MPLQKITKEELIAKSIGVFREKGYYRTNMSDLAIHCGLTKGAFYHHFLSKEEVMLNCLRMSANWFEHHVFSIAYDENISIQDKLNKMAEMTFKAFTNESGGCFFANTILETAHVEDTFKQVMKDFFKSWEEAMFQIFSSKHSNKIARELSIKSLTDIEGSIILMQLHEDRKYLEEAISRCIKSY